MRPPTFTCAWCGHVKPLARTGRMPKFCSDYCRRQPVAAVDQLRSATWHRDAAQRTIDRLTEALARYGALEHAETAHQADGNVSVGDRAPERA